MAIVADNTINSSLLMQEAMTKVSLAFSNLIPAALAAAWTEPWELGLSTSSVCILVNFITTDYGVKKNRSFRFSGRRAIFHQQSFQIFALLSGLATVYLCITLLTPVISSYLIATRFESLTTPVIFWLSFLTGLLLSGWLLEVPNMLQNNVKSGQISIQLAQQTLRFGAYWLILCIISGLVFVILTYQDYSILDNSDLSKIIIIYIMPIVSVMAYCIPILILKEGRVTYGQVSKQESVVNKSDAANFFWLVYPDSGISKRHLAAIDKFSTQSKYIPFTLALPMGSADVFGMHSFWAFTNKRLKALYPTTKIELQDWQRTLPLTNSISGFNRREIYPDLALLPEAVATLRSKNDPVLLFYQPGIELEPWRGLLPKDKVRVILLDGDFIQTEELDIAGYQTVQFGKMPSELDSIFSVTEPTIKTNKPSHSYERIFSFWQQIKNHHVKPGFYRLPVILMLSLLVMFAAYFYYDLSERNDFLGKNIDSNSIQIHQKDLIKVSYKFPVQVLTSNESQDIFFKAYNEKFGTLSIETRQALTLLLNLFGENNDIYDIRQLAYFLATVKHETANRFQPVTEFGIQSYFDKYDAGTTIGKRLGNDVNGDGYRYRGRGYFQIAGKANYLKFTQVLNLNGTNDLVNFPEKALDPNIAYRILVYGAMNGTFTGKKLSDYIYDDQTDYKNARRVFNGMDQSYLISNYAQAFETILREIIQLRQSKTTFGSGF